jgi:hypothetical protein
LAVYLRAPSRTHTPPTLCRSMCVFVRCDTGDRFRPWFRLPLNKNVAPGNRVSASACLTGTCTGTCTGPPVPFYRYLRIDLWLPIHPWLRWMGCVMGCEQQRRHPCDLWRRRRPRRWLWRGQRRRLEGRRQPFDLRQRQQQQRHRWLWRGQQWRPTKWSLLLKAARNPYRNPLLLLPKMDRNPLSLLPKVGLGPLPLLLKARCLR